MSERLACKINIYNSGFETHRGPGAGVLQRPRERFTVDLLRLRGVPELSPRYPPPVARKSRASSSAPPSESSAWRLGSRVSPLVVVVALPGLFRTNPALAFVTRNGRPGTVLLIKLGSVNVYLIKQQTVTEKSWDGGLWPQIIPQSGMIVHVPISVLSLSTPPRT